MNTQKTELTLERLHELLSFDPESGLFRWKVRTSNRVAVGAIAGSAASDGYLQIKIDRRKYLSHRLAWLYVHGRWPAEQLDHINGVRTENRIANLREATNAENAQNCAVRRNNKSGHPGVRWHKAAGKWQAEIKINRVQKCLGRFESLEAAIAARQAAKANLHTFQPTDRGTA